jgi:hypothetical protein
MKDFYDFMNDSPFWKKILFSILICFIFGFAWNIRENFNNDLLSFFLEFICFLTGYILMDRYAYWIYKNSIKKDNKNE